MAATDGGKDKKEKKDKKEDREDKVRQAADGCGRGRTMLIPSTFCPAPVCAAANVVSCSAYAAALARFDPAQASAYHVPADALSPIASPLAPSKLARRLFRLIRRASRARQLKRGVKEVIKALRKGEKGLLVLAGNITPLDVISHLPLLAEETAGVEYVWVESKEELGVSSGTKRATSCVLVWWVDHCGAEPSVALTLVRFIR